MDNNVSAVFIGASAGGLTAIQELLSSLNDKIRLPIIIVQHLPQNAIIDPELVYRRFAHSRKICEATDKMGIESNHIYIAPAGYHLLIEYDRSFSLSQDQLVNFSRPSIDVLFDSVARAYGSEACGILLTGANHDGAQGLLSIHQHNGTTIVQDPNDAEYPTMPQSALDLFKPNYISSISQMSSILTTLAQGEVYG
jgi:two-component system, chemotaxis family, protein-glutamate methylesterase/glutaminase